MDTTWDCLVIGGGAAGLSAALVLGRARRSTLVIDAGGQSNRAAHGIGGLLGSDGRAPDDFYAAGRAELAAYPSVELRAGEVVGGERDGDGDGFVLTLADGTRERARRVLLATGMDYRIPEVPGTAERWGGSVFHCPFCHGWEMRDRALCVLEGGATGVTRALLLRAWSDDVTLLADGLGDEEAERLRAAGVAVDERPVEALRGPGNELEAVVFADGSERPCEGLLVPITLHQRSSLADQLGAEAAGPPAPRAPGDAIGGVDPGRHHSGPQFPEVLAVEPSFHTGVPGLSAAGDVAGVMPSVANAVSAGSTAAAMIVHSLMTE